MENNEPKIYSNVSVPESTSVTSEEIRTDSISPPIDAKMNENGQLVWVDESGNVYCQNPMEQSYPSTRTPVLEGACKLELNQIRSPC